MLGHSALLGKGRIQIDYFCGIFKDNVNDVKRILYDMRNSFAYFLTPSLVGCLGWGGSGGHTGL